MRLKSSKANRPVVLVREEKVIKRVEQLKIKLAALEKKKASLLKALKKAEAKVKYYDKRSSKTAQEDDFKKRLQIKVQQLENQAL